MACSRLLLTSHAVIAAMKSAATSDQFKLAGSEVRNEFILCLSMCDAETNHLQDQKDHDDGWLRIHLYGHMLCSSGEYITSLQNLNSIG